MFWPGFAVAAAAFGQSVAAQTVNLSLQFAAAYREPLFCSGGTDVLACDSGCGWSGAASGGVVELSGGVSQVSEAAGCTRWTYYASGSMNGNLARGQRLRLVYDIEPLVTPGGTARLAYVSVGGSRGGADIVAAGAGPIPLLGGAESSGQVLTPTFVTGASGGSGTWNVEIALEWRPAAGGTFSMAIPAGGVRVELLPRAACAGDSDGDGSITPADVSLFINRWLASLTGGGLDGDFDGDGAVEPADVAAFVAVWLGAVSVGCS